MFLAIDVGNSRTKLGLFSGRDLIAEASIASSEDMLLRGPLAGIRPGAPLDAVAVCSVVSDLTPRVTEAVRTLLGLEAFIIDESTDLGIVVRYDPPSAVGRDRLINAVAAKAAHGSPVIVVGFGTATTFNVVDENGDFVGGAIAPGLSVGADALFAAAPRLPAVPLDALEVAIASDTVAALQSGIVLGHAAMVDGMIRRMKREMAGSPRVVATGGHAAAVAPHSEEIEIVDPALTLKGIYLAWQRNARQ